jgi:type 1 fimbria pilin
VNKQDAKKKKKMNLTGLQTMNRAGMGAKSPVASLRHAAAPASRFAALALIGSLISSAAHATTGNVTFQGNINSASTCVVIVNQNGKLGISANIRQLSSKITGGVPGKVTILQRGTYDVSATTLPAFAAGPTGADTGVTRQVRMSGSAINLVSGFTVTIPEMDGAPGFRVLSGVSNSRVNLDIHYIADRPTSFPSGYYQSIVTVRCE